MGKMIMIHQAREAQRKETIRWQWTAIVVLAVSTLIFTAQEAKIAGLQAARMEDADRYQAQIEIAGMVRDMAVQKLGEFEIQAKQSRAAQAAAYERLAGYRYIGECTVTAYCPCAECCGQWADGLTATGIPAVPGIVAVDQEVIPLGSTVIIDGQRYLAADTGVTGMAVDICMEEHGETEAHGVRTAEVWAVEP